MASFTPALGYPSHASPSRCTFYHLLRVFPSTKPRPLFARGQHTLRTARLWFSPFAQTFARTHAHTTMHASPTPCYKEIQGHFTLQQRFGQGSYGEVFKAQHKSTGQVIALKRVSKGALNLIKHMPEIRAMKSCSSTHIVAYYGCEWLREDLLVRNFTPFRRFRFHRSQRTGERHLARLALVRSTSTLYVVSFKDGQSCAGCSRSGMEAPLDSVSCVWPTNHRDPHPSTGRCCCQNYPLHLSVRVFFVPVPF